MKLNLLGSAYNEVHAINSIINEATKFNLSATSATVFAE